MKYERIFGGKLFAAQLPPPPQDQITVLILFPSRETYKIEIFLVH